jgi:hypothetical protein
MMTPWSLGLVRVDARYCWQLWSDEPTKLSVFWFTYVLCQTLQRVFIMTSKQHSHRLKLINFSKLPVIAGKTMVYCDIDIKKEKCMNKKKHI